MPVTLGRPRGTPFSWGRGPHHSGCGLAERRRAGSLRRLSFGKLSECSSGSRHGLIQELEDAIAPELGPRGAWGTRSEATAEPPPASEAWVPHDTAWRGHSAPPQSPVLPAKVRALGPFLSKLHLLLGPPSVTERASLAKSFPFRTTFLAGGWRGGRAKAGAGWGESASEVKAGWAGGVPVLAVWSWRASETTGAHQAHGPALLLEPSLKHGEGDCLFHSASLTWVILWQEIPRTATLDPREGG